MNRTGAGHADRGFGRSQIFPAMTDASRKRPITRAAALVAGALLLGACGGGDGGMPVAEGTGSFQEGPLEGMTVAISATENAGEVSGEATITRASDPPVTLTLECSGEPVDGVVIVGGEVSDSEGDEFPVGSRIAVLIKGGDPDGMMLWFEDPPSAESCDEFVDDIPADLLSDPSIFQPVDGDITTG